jgi:hypothetical protein
MDPPSESADRSETLHEVLSGFELQGYRGQMAARPEGQVLCLTCHTESAAADMRVDALERLEGVSDPDDMLAVAALRCPVCNALGTLVLGYGPEAASDDSEVLALLGDIAG